MVSDRRHRFFGFKIKGESTGSSNLFHQNHSVILLNNALLLMLSSKVTEGPPRRLHSLLVLPSLRSQFANATNKITYVCVYTHSTIGEYTKILIW